MSESPTTLASFNVDKKSWDEFKALASKEGRSASYGLNELIKQAVQRKSISPIDAHNESIKDIDLSGYIKRSELEDLIKLAIAPLASEIESVKLIA